MVRVQTLMVCFGLLLVGPAVWAQDDPAPKADENTKPTTPADKDKHEHPDSDWVSTEHTVGIDSDMILPYTATAGTIQLKDNKDKPKASVFFISYTHPADSQTEYKAKVKPQDRPVMFCFNGGPGSSSIWLHMGAFGPKRVKFDDVGHAVGPPYELTNNLHSILSATDLVFIDPVSTGFSRAEEGTNASEYHSVTGDINSVAEFIRLWLTKNDRWLSPKYLCGESYGTTRAAGVAKRLQSRGIDLNGIVLVSAVLSFQTLRFDEGNDLPYQLYLPTYTALAHYHERLPGQMQQRELPKLLDEVEAWSREVYGPALMQGAELPEDERLAIAEKLVMYTALPKRLILESDLRVPQWRFSDNLLASEDNVIGRFDGRIVGPDLDKTSDRSGTSDPSYTRVAGGFTATFNDYVRNELGYETDMDYGVLVGVRWDYDRARNNYLNVSSDLRTAMAENPKLRVYIAAGYYDLATPYHAAQYTINHSIKHPDARRRVTFGYFESGHMVFTHTPSLERLQWELGFFLTGKEVPAERE